MVANNTQSTRRTISRHDLGMFTGGGDQYRHLSGMVYTEGVAWLAEQAGAFWLIDLIVSHQPAARRNPWLREIQFWHLRVNDDNTAVAYCVEDSGEPAVIQEELEYTDFAKCGLKEVKLYVCGNVILLPSEY